MLKRNAHLFLFFSFAVGLPLWAMQNNSASPRNIHGCSGECYENWRKETGGVVALAAAKAEAKASASPEELGRDSYAGCIACHGSKGEGGVGPELVGQSSDAIYQKLAQYKKGETRGTQSALMWSQSATLSDTDMKNIAAFVASLAKK